MSDYLPLRVLVKARRAFSRSKLIYQRSDRKHHMGRVGGLPSSKGTNSCNAVPGMTIGRTGTF